nr:RNA polymerase sigma factor [Saprospiraceae bacterium]
MNTVLYNQCVKEHSDSLMRYAFKVCGSREDSADAVQEAYIRLWSHRGEVNSEKVKSWLFTAVYRILIDWYRKNKRIQNPGEMPEQAAEENLSIGHYSDPVVRALDSLSPTQKSIVMLRDIEEYPYEEIAEIMDLSLSQVKVYLFRARKKLRISLEPLRSGKKDK